MMAGAMQVRADHQGQIPVLVPHHELASESNLREAWLCGEGVVLTFDSKVWFRIQPNEDVLSSAEFNSTMMARYPGRYSIENVRGRQAAVADPAQPPGEQRWGGGVHWVETGWVYDLMGAFSGLNRGDLVSIASTVSEP